MGDSVMVDEYKQDQRAAICYQKWRDKKAKAAYVIEAAGEEYIFAKEPIDSDIEKRRKTASNPPKDALPGLNPNGGADPNPDNSNAPSSDLPTRGSSNQQKKARGEGIDSMDQGKKSNLDDMAWYMGGLTPELDPHTGLAKWPLSFKRVEKDVKRPNKPGKKGEDVPKNKKTQERPPTAA